jgi:hypothetical protein
MMCFIFFIVEKLNAEWQKMDGWLGVVFSEKKPDFATVFRKYVLYL